MLRQLIFAAFLHPLIERNYRLRAAGKLPDEWYWADQLGFGWGYTIDEPPNA